LKKILILILTLTSIISISMVAYAKGPGPGNPPPQPPPHNRLHSGDRMEARRVLTKTKEYLSRAQRVAWGPQRKYLGKAFDLQADARRRYKQSRYDQAIRVSLRAREIAQSIIKEAKRRNPPPPPHDRRKDDDRKSSIHINLKL
jgi:hypothetical protein